MYEEAQKILKILKKIVLENKWIKPFIANVIKKVNGFVEKFSFILNKFFGRKKLHEAEDIEDDNDPLSEKGFSNTLKMFFKRLLQHVIDAFSFKNIIKHTGLTLKVFFLTILIILLYSCVFAWLTSIIMNKFGRVTMFSGSKHVKPEIKKIIELNFSPEFSLGLSLAYTVGESLVKSALRYYLLKKVKTNENRKVIKTVILIMRTILSLGKEKKSIKSFTKNVGVSMVTDAFEHEFHLSIENKWQAIGLGALMEFAQIASTSKSFLHYIKSSKKVCLKKQSC